MAQKIPNLYYKIWPERFGTANEEDIEWVTPDSEDDVKDMLRALAQTGYSYVPPSD